MCFYTPCWSGLGSRADRMTENQAFDRESTLALLLILALGKREIERGEFQDAEAVFDELDQLDIA